MENVQLVATNYMPIDSGSKVVNMNTGEVSDAVPMLIPTGSKVITPDQLEVIEKKKEKDGVRRLRKMNNSELAGRMGFYFIPNSADFKGLSSATVTRLIYLNTFLDYDNGLLIKGGRNIRKRDLADVLKLSRNTVNSFWDEVNPFYLSQTEDGTLTTNPNIFKRGKLQRQSEFYRRLYNKGVRTLYEKAHKKSIHLGYLFQMLPYINIEYNMLCKNPLEENLDDIEVLTVKEFCRLIGYDYNQISRLANIYKHITFDIKGKQERFCSFVTDGLDLANGQIFVNPRILYSGTDYVKVQVLGKFCQN